MMRRICGLSLCLGVIAFFAVSLPARADDPVIPRLQNNLPVNSASSAPPTSTDTDSVIEEFTVSSMVTKANYQFTHNITCGGGGGCIFGGRTRIYFSTNGTDWVLHENFDVTVGISPRMVTFSPAIGPYKYVKWETYSSSQVTSAPAGFEMTSIDVGDVFGTAAGGGGTPTPSPSSSPSSTPTPGGGGSTPTPTPTSGTSGGTPTPTPTPVLISAAACSTGISNVTVSASVTDATVTFTSASATKGTLYVYSDSRTSPPKDETKKAAGYATNSRNFAETTATKNHTFAVDALSPETTYYYTLLSGATQECEHSFTTQAVAVEAVASPTPTPTATDGTGSGGGDGSDGNGHGDNDGDAVSTSVLGDSFPWESVIAALFLIGTLGGVLVPGLGVNPTSWWFNVASKRKRINPWGRVWSTLTQAGIPGVMVSLIDPSHYNRVVERAKSQEDGSFGFTAPAGKYVLWAEKSGFVFPSQHAPSGYTGGEVTIDEGGIIQTDIPMDQTQKNRPFRDKWIHLLLQLEVFRLPLLIFGTMVTIAFLIYEFWWVTLLFLIYYSILWYWEFKRIHDSQHLLTVLDSHNKPVAFASVRLKTAEDKIVLTRSTNDKGQVFILVPKGEYGLEITPPVSSDLRVFKQSLELERGILLRPLTVKLQGK